MKERIILTGQCKDRSGVVARITTWVFEQGGNILDLDQHVDPVSNCFFIRVQWEQSSGTEFDRESLSKEFRELVADEFGLSFELHSSSERPKMAILVSKMGHCLWDILSRCQSGELNVEIPLIISNHETFRSVAETFGIPYHCLPITPETKAGQEAKQMELLREHSVDFVVLARYMQILSADFVEQYPNRIINIHHSFLPAFAGARPYHRAYERGVKLIGATAHYVTSDLDEGPIIEQNTARVNHRDSVDDLVRIGRDLEKIVLSRAIFKHTQRQVIVDGNRTVVFD